MAKPIQLKHKDSGVIKTGYYGFSWTTLFFGGLPALFRGDFLTFLGLFVVMIILGIWTYGIGAAIAEFIWAFFYNGYYTRKLLERGYEFSDIHYINEEAANVLGVAIPTVALTPTDSGQEHRTTSQTSSAKQSNISALKEEDKTLSNDAYKIYLVKKYPLEFNEVLKKYIFNDKLFDSVEDALLAVHQEDQKNESLGNQNNRITICFTVKDEAISFLGSKMIDVISLENGKFTVTEKSTTQFFYTESDFLKYANKKAMDYA